jgi:hypothetical protein
MMIFDKNGKEIKKGNICKAIDSKGKAWIAPIVEEEIHWCGTRKPCKELVFKSNYDVVLHPGKHKKFEIIKEVL